MRKVIMILFVSLFYFSCTEENSAQEENKIKNMETIFRRVINQDKPILVDFSAAWCSPCKIQVPIINELQKRIGNKASIIKIDVDINKDLANEYNVQAIPTLMIIKKGKICWQKSGVVQADELEKLLNEN